MQSPAAASSVQAAYRYQTKAATTAGAGGTVIDSFDVSTADQLLVVITTATAALTAFEVLASATDSGTAVSVASAGTDYTNKVAPVIDASGDLAAATAGNHYLLLDVRGMHTVQIKCTSAGTATVALQAGSN